MNKNIEAEITVKIPFYDVDSMDIVWHGHYVKYLEDARCALFDKINFNYNDMRESGYGWPIVTMELKYIRPCLFMQEITIKAVLADYKNCIHIKYLIADSATGEVLTKAETKQMAVDMSTMQACFVSPEILIKKVEDHG